MVSVTCDSNVILDVPLADRRKFGKAVCGFPYSGVWATVVQMLNNLSGYQSNLGYS
jgi:hypothetical protein